MRPAMDPTRAQRRKQMIERLERELADLEKKIATADGEAKIEFQEQKKQMEQDLAGVRGEAKGIAMREE